MIKQLHHTSSFDERKQKLTYQQADGPIILKKQLDDEVRPKNKQIVVKLENYYIRKVKRRSQLIVE